MHVQHLDARGRGLQSSRDRSGARAPIARCLALLQLLLVLLSSGCGPVRLISAYDQVLDQSISEVHTRIATFVGRMESSSGKPEGTYAANVDFYSEIGASLSTMLLRVEAQAKSEITAKQIRELQSNFEQLRKLHELGGERGLRRVVAQPAMAALDVNCRAILSLEAAKRRGEDKN